MKRLSMLLIPCIAISANAATFNAQGKTINSNDAKNPGIVKFEKNKAVAAKNNQNKPAALAKTYTPVQVTATKGVYDQNTGKYELNNNTNIPEAQYLSTIDQLEKADNPRKNDRSGDYTDYSMPPLPNKTGNTCYEKNNGIYEYYYYSYAEEKGIGFQGGNIPFAIGYESKNNVYNYDWDKLDDSYNKERCKGIGPYKNTCGQGIHIYSIAGDEPISLPYNGICIDSRQQNYKEGIKLYYANKFIRYYAPKAAIHYYKDRTKYRYAQHPVKPYDNNMHIGNIISSVEQNQTAYNHEAAALDDYIYNNRVIEFASYTNKGGKTGAGLALNAISVAGVTGRYAFDENTIPATYTVNPNNPNTKRLVGHVNLEDSPKNPLLKSGVNMSTYPKPEIYNVSNGIYADDKIIAHDNNEFEYEAITDAWGASTVSATMTADLLERHPFYKWHPEVVKALWISASAERTDKDYPLTNIYNKNNRQYIGALATFDDLLFNNKSRYWYGNNTDFLNDNKITFTEDVEPGQMYNFAIAWLVRGDYAISEKNLSAKFKLTVSYMLPSGEPKEKTNRDEHPYTFEYIKRITIPAGVNKVTVTIERTRNTGDRIILGYNMHKMRYK